MKQTLKRAWTVTLGNPQLKIGLVLLCILLLVALFAPVIAPYDPYFMSDELVEAPSALHPLGTDGLGRDILSMLIFGTRTSLVVGVTAAFIAGIIGTLIGGVAGYFGGKVDAVLGELINVFMMMPTFFLVLIVVALFGSGLFNVMVVMGLTSWVSNAKLMRAQAMSLRQRTFVRSAEAIGEGRLLILFRHVVPNGIFPIIANTTMGIASAILTEASLSFLGVGVDPTVPTWGAILSTAKDFVITHPYMAIYPGLAILVTVLSISILGDGLRDLLDPKMK